MGTIKTPDEMLSDLKRLYPEMLDWTAIYNYLVEDRVAIYVEFTRVINEFRTNKSCDEQIPA